MGLSAFKAKKIASSKIFVKKTLSNFLKILGLELLTEDRTKELLTSSVVQLQPGTVTQLPTIPNCYSPQTIIFNEQTATPEACYVWTINDQLSEKHRQLPNGGLLIGGKIICTDFNHHSFYQNIFHLKPRKPKAVNTLIAPWSQYIDGIYFCGYYDFLFLVVAKICRIKDAIPLDEFANATVAYPLFETAYENEYLDLLDVKKELVVDSRLHNITFRKGITGNSSHSLFPNKEDIASLKRNIQSKLALSKKSNDRIYISRSGRRRVKNEEELIILLKKYNFKIIEDKERTIAEQVQLYKNAAFILGPHGASFSNIIWCEPGTHLFELFSPNYIQPFFLYLAELVGVKYSAYYQGVAAQNMYFKAALAEDIFVSIPEIEACLDKVFQEDFSVQVLDNVVI